MLEQAAAIHVTSLGEKRQISDLAPGVPRVIVPNIVPAPTRGGDGESFRRRYVHGTRAPIALFLGRVSRRKNVDQILEAFAKTRSDAHLVVAGPDDEELTPSLLRLAEALGISDRVKFTGMLGSDEKLDAFAAADVFVTASAAENFGLALVEAMASGVPPVVSCALDIAPEIEAAGAGRLAVPTADGLARELGQLLSNRAMRAATAVAAQRFARQYQPAHITPRLVELYEMATSAIMGRTAGSVRPVSRAIHRTSRRTSGLRVRGRPNER
jgi:glycosyltransferase involved in cell wall biosynthesis